MNAETNSNNAPQTDAIVQLAPMLSFGTQRITLETATRAASALLATNETTEQQRATRRVSGDALASFIHQELRDQFDTVNKVYKAGAVEHFAALRDTFYAAYEAQTYPVDAVDEKGKPVVVQQHRKVNRKTNSVATTTGNAATIARGMTVGTATKPATAFGVINPFEYPNLSGCYQQIKKRIEAAAAIEEAKLAKAAEEASGNAMESSDNIGGHDDAILERFLGALERHPEWAGKVADVIAPSLTVPTTMVPVVKAGDDVANVVQHKGRKQAHG